LDEGDVLKRNLDRFVLGLAVSRATLLMDG